MWSGGVLLLMLGAGGATSRSELRCAACAHVVEQLMYSLDDSRQSLEASSGADDEAAHKAREQESKRE
eukprot:scaffold167239_cov17-Tisochrysis_lutea.AAC.1